jgi:hypothetical protein
LHRTKQPPDVSWGRNIYLGAIVSSPVRCGFFVSIITSFYPLFKTLRGSLGQSHLCWCLANLSF